MNTTFNYHVITNFPQLGGAETELHTNDIYQALDIYLDEVQNGNPTLIMDGHTGEVVAIANHEGIEDHANSEFTLIIRGYLATLVAEEEELMAAKEEIPSPDYPSNSMILVVNSGEEGLGNLKGSRRIMADFGHRVKEFLTFDGNANAVVTKAVGSRRYRVIVRTEGGHSYARFGAPNAIAQLSSLIARLYEIRVPEIGRTTYNVGTISGGTSVNTIAQNAEMLFEFRSDEREALDIMQAHFDRVLEEFRERGVQIEVEMVGDRPCGLEVDNSFLAERAVRAVEAHYGFSPRFSVGSTDCNIPLSMGIPAICPGCVMGAGAHTREEYVEIDSLLPGLKVAAELILHHF